jgi:hypothetical protein
VKLPNGEWSRDFPKYRGLFDDLTPAEQATRDNYDPAPAYPAIQKLFEHMLQQLAARGGWKSVKEYFDKKLGGVIYHFTVNFLGGHTVNHVDEYLADGPGKWIFNLALQGSGLLFFAQDQARPDGTWRAVPAAAVLQRAGDCVGFTGDARIFMHHAVLKALPIVQLPTSATRTSKEVPCTEGWRKGMRVVASIRGGILSEDEKKAWLDQFGVAYNLSKVHTYTDYT